MELFKRWLRIALIGAVAFTVLLAAIVYFAYRSTSIPDPNTAFQAQTTNVYYAGGKAELGQFAEQNRESIPLADVPQVMQDAIVAAEDRTFWTNKGIDPKGILRAAFSNAQGNATQGASTITQQYVKILYLTQQRTLKRKIKEAFLSLKIQQEQSKSQILEGYLNTIYFGRGAYGVQAASQAYFGIPAKQLNASQSAMLSAVVNSPTYLSPDRGKASRAALLSRYDYVLDGMIRRGAITQDRADRIANRLPRMVKVDRGNIYGGQRGFMLGMVRKELVKIGFDQSQIEAGGLKVTTTFTKQAMAAAKNAVLTERPPGLKALHVATASVDTRNGGLLGFFGGQDYLDSQLDWATLGGSPGSAFKAFALAAAIKDGFSLKDTFDGNSPYRFPDGREVKNEGSGSGQSYGSHVSMIQAAEDSINTAFIDMTQSMDHGPQKILDMAVKMGIPRDSPGLEANSGISLGSATISPINMANAYATIANGGIRHDVHVVKKVVRASDGEVLYTAPKSAKRVLDADLAADTSYALQKVVTSGTGRSTLGLGRPAGGKTGTATNAHDRVSSAWFVGYTPQVSTAVMYVRGKGNEALDGYLPSYFGASYPAATWTNLMRAMMDGLPVETFPPPVYLDGDAPSEGHAPYTPPPKPKKTKPPRAKPKPTPTPTPTRTVTPTPTHTPRPEPSPTETEPCTILPDQPNTCPSARTAP